MAERFYTEEEVARKLRVSIRTVQRLISSSQLSVSRIGRSVRISEEDLNEHLQRKRETA